MTMNPGDRGVDTITAEALREMNDEARRNAINKAKQLISNIAEKQRRIKEYQESIIGYQKELAAVKVEEYSI